jgi:hypothetical protein
MNRVASPTAKVRPTWPRRLLRRTAIAVGMLFLLAAAVWLLRRPLFEPMLRRELARILTAELGGEAEVGAVRGDWLRSVVVEGLSLRGGSGPLRSIEDGRLVARFSLPRLLRGDLSGIETARLEASRVHVVLPEPSARGGSPPAWQELARLLPAGAEVVIGEYRIGADGARRGALSVTLAEGGVPRAIAVRGAGLRADVTFAPDGPDLSAVLGVDDPGGALRALGIDVPLHEGSVQADVRWKPSRDTLSGRASLRGVRLLDEACGAELGFELQGGNLGLTVAELRVRDAVASGEVHLAIDALSSVQAVVDQARARFHVESRDLAVWSDVWPAELRPWLRGKARVEGTLAGGALAGEAVAIDAPGVRLAASAVRLPLARCLSAGSVEDWLPEVTADVTLAIDDLRPWADRLPEGARSLLGMRGTLRAHLAQARLTIDESSLRDGATELRVAARGLGLDGEGTIAIALRAPEPQAFDLPAIGAIRLAGECTVTVHGPLAAPRAEGRLALSRIAHSEVEVGALRAGLRFAGRAIDVTGLTIERAGRPGAGSTTALTGSVRIELPDRERAAPRLVADLTGRFDPALLPPDLVAAAPGLAPCALELKGSVDLVAPLPRGSAVLSLRDVRWPGAPAFDLALDVAVGGAAEDPEVDARLGAVLPDGVASLGVWAPELLGPVPPGPIKVHVVLAGRATAPVVRVLRVATTADDAIEVSGAGELPFAFAAGIRARAPARPLVLDLAVRAPQTAAGASELRGRARLDDRGLTVEHLLMRTPQGEVAGSLVLAASPAAVFGDPSQLGAAAVSGELTMQDLVLEAVPAALLPARGLAGRVSGRVLLAGTVDRPRPEVDVRLAAFATKLRGVQRIENGSGRVRLTPHRVDVEAFQAEMGSGRVEVNGHVASDGLLWAAPVRATVDLRFTAHDALFVRGDGLMVRGDADLRARSTGERIDVTGFVQARSGKYVKRLSALPDLRARGGAAAAGRGLVPLQLEGELGDRVVFDVGLSTAHSFEVRTGIYDVDLDASLRLRGRANHPSLTGTVAGSDGTIRLPGMSFRTESLLLRAAEERPDAPAIELRATGRRLGYRVLMLVSGGLDAPEVRLTSTPPLPPEDLAVLVGTGRLPKDLREGGLAGSASMLGSFAAEEVIAYLFGSESTEAQESLVDRLTIESGYEVSKNGLEAIRAEILILPKLAIEAERDVYENYNAGLVFRIRF